MHPAEKEPWADLGPARGGAAALVENEIRHLDESIRPGRVPRGCYDRVERVARVVVEPDLALAELTNAGQHLHVPLADQIDRPHVDQRNAAVPGDLRDGPVGQLSKPEFA